MRTPGIDVEAITADDLDLAHHEVLAALRPAGPIAWVPAVGGWVVIGRELAVAVMRDAATFTVDDPRFSTGQVVGPSMLSLDGDEHRRHRDPFVAAYRPAEVTARYAEAVSLMADDLVAALAPRGEGDLRRELAGPLAVAVVARSLGLDGVDPDTLLGWYAQIVQAVERVSFGAPIGDEAAAAFAALGDALDRAAHLPGSVLLSVTDVLGRDEVISNAAVFMFGGIETSEAMTANVLMHLLSWPEQLARVRDDRSLVDAAVEESLRLEPAASRVDRYATRDVEVAGVQVRAGDLVVVSLAGANRDPSAYDRPDEFRVDRPEARTHVTFAQGPHACIGAQLARMETRAAVMAVLDRLHDVTLVEPVVATGPIFRKPRTLRARWRPAS